jgi:hypothetical protein
MLGGPSFATADDEATAGFVGRIDVALPLAGHISTAASFSTLVVPSWNGDLFYQTSLGVGLRLR